MNINIEPITLIFQVLNFFIAYILLRFLLLKPAYAIIQEEQYEREHLHNNIAYQRALLTRKEQEIKDHWRGCQEHFLKNKPSIDNPELYIFKYITPSIEQPHIAPQTITKLIKNVQDAIIKKVE